MSKVFFTSDLHFGHKKIVEYTNRSVFTTQENHDKDVIALWNSQVGKNDIVYQLGDFVFNCRDIEVWQSVVSKLNGRIIHIKGNHDSSDVLKKSGHEWYDLKRVKVGKQHIVLCHFALRVWDMYHHGSWHLYGHCLDDATEVLTEHGWKHRKDVSVQDKIATFNIENSNIEYQHPVNKFEYDYSGTMISFTSKRVDFLITPNHRLVHGRYNKQGRWDIKEVSHLSGQYIIPVCGNNTKEDYPMEDDWIRLYVHICTDGSFENDRKLVRFHLKKERKIKELRTLLDRLNIDYSENIQKTGNTKINFKTPTKFQNLVVKPLDREFIMNLSKRQVDIVVDTYKITDGSPTGKDCIQICTGKLSEANLLQEMLVTSGISCNLIQTKKGTYVLSLNVSRVRPTLNTNNFKEESYTGKVWCLEVPNSAFIVRRGGKVHVTGNSHGSLEGTGRSIDVGLDNSYNVFGEHRFFTMDDLRELIGYKEVVFHDHHNDRTKQ